MESATLKRGLSGPTVLQSGLVVALLAAAAIAWGVTGSRMGEMDAGPGTELGEVGWFTGIWVVMMAAMMFPSIWPMVVMFARVQARAEARGSEPAAGATAVFISGYLAVWTLAGLAAYAVFELARSADLGFLAWDEGGRYLAGGVLAAAAAYQLTPLKNVCLIKCRNPLSFLLHGWRPGRAGALRLGFEHGAWCFGCCWALMASLFALGVMSIGWMALIAAFIAVEKLLPWKALANRAIAVALLALALGVLVAPERVPGLTIPGTADADHAMESMGTHEGAHPIDRAGEMDP